MNYLVFLAHRAYMRGEMASLETLQKLFLKYCNVLKDGIS
jgi:hypothetical protein